MVLQAAKHKPCLLWCVEGYWPEWMYPLARCLTSVLLCCGKIKCKEFTWLICLLLRLTRCGLVSNENAQRAYYIHQSHAKTPTFPQSPRCWERKRKELSCMPRLLHCYSARYPVRSYGMQHHRTSMGRESSKYANSLLTFPFLSPHAQVLAHGACWGGRGEYNHSWPWSMQLGLGWFILW